MQSWEERFKRDTGFADRSQYKIFDCGVRPAPVLILGINPGADPAEVAPNGVDRVGKGPPHAASTTFHEKDEHDLLDCNWQRTEKLVEFLLEILDSDDTKQVRSSVIMANLAFERARKSSEIDDLQKRRMRLSRFCKRSSTA